MRTLTATTLCLVLLGCGWWHRNSKPMDVFVAPRVEVTTHVATAEDGVSLALHRHLDGKPPNDAAVLLCHSMGFHSGVWAAGGKRGLAAALALDGYDVWRLDFRGCGMSGPAPPATTLDDYALKDIPAAIATIAKTTRRHKIFVIGHGTGGSAATIYLLSAQKSMMSGLVVIGSPLTAPLPRDAILKDLAVARRHLADPLLRYPSIIPDLSPAPPKGWESLFVKPSNIDPDVRDALFRTCSEPIPKGVLDQYVQMLESGTLKSSDGKRTYLDECSAVRLPLLAICGKGDNFAPPSAVRAVYHSVTSIDKTFQLLCRANDYRPNYGHLDLLCGRDVEVSVFTIIEQWLRARSNGDIQ